MDRGVWQAAVHGIAKVWVASLRRWHLSRTKGNRGLKIIQKLVVFGTSLEVQWLRLCTSLQGVRVRFLVREHTCCMVQKLVVTIIY